MQRRFRTVSPPPELVAEIRAAREYATEEEKIEAMAQAIIDDEPDPVHRAELVLHGDAKAFVDAMTNAMAPINDALMDCANAMTKAFVGRGLF